MTQMVRKQIYIRSQQQKLLARLAKSLGVSEAEVIRRALDDKLSGGQNRSAKTVRPDRMQALDEMLALARKLHRQGEIANRRRSWTREDLYEDRIGRHVKNPG
jgi:hypothetical protein